MSAPTPLDVIATEAKFLSVGVCCRLIPVLEVFKWLEGRLREYESPPVRLTDVAHAICESPDKLDVSWALADLARDFGVASLQLADVRRLLGWVVRALDAKRISPCHAEITLHWIAKNTPPIGNFAEEILSARARFRFLRRFHRTPKQGWRELRQWCTYASVDPAAN